MVIILFLNGSLLAENAISLPSPAGYAYESKYPYSHKGFYAASPDKECDLFRCLENGKLYLPCGNDLQEYMEQPQKRKDKERER